MTDRGNFEDSVKVIKALTTGEFQTDWCLQTGYYPCSKSALESAAYQAFINEDQGLDTDEKKQAAYSSPTRVAYREGSRLNAEEYMGADKGWVKFVDPAFKGSSEIRSVVKGVLDSVFAITVENVEVDSQYVAKLNELENAPTIKGQSTIKFVH